jgi:PPOX class probable F420-dependent enzyme
MVSPLAEPIRKFLESESVGTIATLRPDGRIRATLVYYVLDGDRILISTESQRGKGRDVQKTGWASFCVSGHEKPFPSCTVEGPARILTTNIGEPTARILESIRGVRPDAVPTDEGLAALDRVILEIGVEKVYGVSYIQ